MNNLIEATLRLIRDYISCSEYMCSILRDEYPAKESLLRARRINIIPKTGELPGKVFFNFHGGGCYFEFENGSIDLDFGPDDRCDGFDYYRLKNYLSETRKVDYKELHNSEILKREFENLILNGEIVNSKWLPNPHLFYLKEKKM